MRQISFSKTRFYFFKFCTIFFIADATLLIKIHLKTKENCLICQIEIEQLYGTMRVNLAENIIWKIFDKETALLPQTQIF